MTTVSQIIAQMPVRQSERVRIVSDQSVHDRAEFVLYWMRTAVRANENQALDAAIHFANQLSLPIFVYHVLSERYPFASDRHHTFILQGAKDVQAALAQRDIGYVFHLERKGHHGSCLIELAKRAALVVTEDMPVDPLHHWTRRLCEATESTVIAVDTACVLPMQIAGRAFTRAFEFRDATQQKRRERLQDQPFDVEPLHEAFVPGNLPFEPVDLRSASTEALVSQCDIDHSIGPVPDTMGGSTAGYARWTSFANSRLRRYASDRNNALLPGVSRMSAYLHYGMVSPLRIAREAADIGGKGAEKYLDELLIWRELAYAFCFYREDHDQLTAIPTWATQTLSDHESDPRTQLPSWETLARGRTNVALWNAAQQSLLIHGELHNNVRMTWGKAFLSWTNDAESALQWMIDLNHRYALDGRDPASYGGLLWCLGQFDRPFTPPQPIFGTVRTRPIEANARRLEPSAFSDHCTRPYVEPMPHIAVVGAGLAGLTCARFLTDHGYDVTVFEKSRGVGGRMATRRADESLRFDHGAQYFTVRDERFQRMVDSWTKDGIVEEWSGRIAVLNGDSSPAEQTIPARNRDASESPVRYVACPGMNGICKHLGSEQEIVLETRVAYIEQSNAESLGRNSKWQVVDEDGQSLGMFDNVVVATPAEQAAAILKNLPRLAEVAASCDMAPCWAVMLAFDDFLPLEFDGAFVNNSALSWIARNSAKPGRTNQPESWILHAAADWTKANATRSREEIVTELLAELESVTGLVDMQPSYSTAHYWRYAIPTSPLPEPTLFDARVGIAVCGDWCGGPRVEGAYLSGAAAAGRLLGAWNERWTQLAGGCEQ